MIRTDYFMLKNPRRAAVLIMTMMAVTLTFMMIYVLTQTSGIGLNNTSSFYDREAALQAAQSGMDYAVTQLQSHREWKGDCHRAYWKNNGKSEYKNYNDDEDKDLKVIESYGNVVGLITNRAGYKSAFRIKFNYELTPSDIDAGKIKEVPCSSFAEPEGAEPSPSISINMPYVSVNNLNGTSEALMYRANADGIGISGETENLEPTTKDSATRKYANHVPPQRACLIVEGIAGNGLRDCKKPEDVFSVMHGYSVTRRYVESYYTFNAPVLRGYAAYAKGTLNASTNNMYVKSVGYQNAEYKIPAPGSICSNTNISIDGKLNTYDGTVYSPQEPGFITDDTKYKFYRFSGNIFRHLTKDYIEVTFKRAPSEITSGTNSVSVDVNQVATAKTGEGYQIKSGLYQWHTAADSTDSAKRYELRYYPDEKEPFALDTQGRPVPSEENKYNYEIMVASNAEEGTVTIKDGAGKDKVIDKKALIPDANTGKVIMGENGVLTSPILEFSGEVYCNGPLAIGVDLAEVQDFCPVLKLTPGSVVDPLTGKIDYTKKEDGVLHSAGNLTLVSTIKGSGALVAKDAANTPYDISMIGESALNSNSDGLAVYGKNVNLLSLDMGSTQSLAFTGENSGGGGDDEDRKPFDISFNEIKTQLYDQGLLTDDDNPTQYARDKAKKTIADWILKNKHVTISVESFEPSANNAGFYFVFKYLKSVGNGGGDSDNKSRYIVYVPNLSMGLVILGRDPVSLGGNAQHYTTTTNFPKPEDSYIAAESSGSSVKVIDDSIEEIGIYKRPIDYKKEYTDICYGDQVFNGVICATNNFTANLGNNKLIVNGAVRAENGNMTLNCGSIDLTYDEECVAKLLPLYCSLTCEMWRDRKSVV